MTNACLGLKKKDGGDESKPTFNTGSLTKSVDFKLTQPLWNTLQDEISIDAQTGAVNGL